MAVTQALGLTPTTTIGGRALWVFVIVSLDGGHLFVLPCCDKIFDRRNLKGEAVVELLPWGLLPLNI